MGRRIRVLGAAGLVIVAQIAAGSVVRQTVAAPLDRLPAPAAAVDRGPLAEAKRLGRRVEVPAEHRETQTVYANPDGTYTADLFLEPVRVRRGTKWVPVGTRSYAPASDTSAPRTGFAQVFSGYPDNAYWGGDGEGVAKVGRCWEGDGWCNGIGIAVASSI